MMSHSQESTALLRRIVTEKSVRCESLQTYVFKVEMSATKEVVSKAIECMLNKKPLRVNVVRVKGTRKAARNNRPGGRTKDWKKAYVTMNEGDVLEFES